MSGYKMTVREMTEDTVEIRYYPVNPGKEGFAHIKTIELPMPYSVFISIIEQLAEDRKEKDVSNK